MFVLVALAVQLAAAAPAGAAQTVRAPGVDGTSVWRIPISLARALRALGVRQQRVTISSPSRDPARTDAGHGRMPDAAARPLGGSLLRPQLIDLPPPAF